MSDVRIVDDDGDVMRGIEKDGLLFPPFEPSVIHGLSSVKIRKDDILMCSYPKSGSHWIWEITRLLLAGRLDFDDINKRSTMMEKTPESDYLDLPGPRILNTHVRLEQLPVEMYEKKPRIIHLMRNPKDVTVSAYNFYKGHKYYEGKWENFLQLMGSGQSYYGSWFDYTRSWEKVKSSHPDWPIITVCYEDMKEDPVQEIRRIRDFLDIDRPETFLRDVCTHCSFNSMKKIKATSDAIRLSFRKGEVGDWKNWFTVAQSESFDRLYQKKMKDCRLNLRYTLDSCHKQG